MSSHIAYLRKQNLEETSCHGKSSDSHVLDTEPKYLNNWKSRETRFEVQKTQTGTMSSSTSQL